MCSCAPFVATYILHCQLFTASHDTRQSREGSSHPFGRQALLDLRGEHFRISLFFHQEKVRQKRSTQPAASSCSWYKACAWIPCPDCNKLFLALRVIAVFGAELGDMHRRASWGNAVCAHLFGGAV